MIRTLDEAIKYHRTIASKILKTVHYLRMKGHEKGADDSEKCAKDHEQLAEWLTELQERREADRWIPVSERLPKEYDGYLVMWRSLTEGFPDRLFYEICEYEPDEDEWERIEQAGKAGAEIVAWRPLPKPYESEDSE